MFYLRLNLSSHAFAGGQKWKVFKTQENGISSLWEKRGKSMQSGQNTDHYQPLLAASAEWKSLTSELVLVGRVAQKSQDTENYLCIPEGEMP
jgi:hypothetical protein